MGTFSNRSDEIHAPFCEYCDKVGVEWRRMNRWNISVARRESVELMDRHIGPKRRSRVDLRGRLTRRDNPRAWKPIAA
jgi:hypothetical protein